MLIKLRGPYPKPYVPAGTDWGSLLRLGVFLGRRRYRLNGSLKRIFIAIGAVLFSGINELLALGAGVFDGLGLGHDCLRLGGSLGDLLGWREVRHG